VPTKHITFRESSDSKVVVLAIFFFMIPNL